MDKRLTVTFVRESDGWHMTDEEVVNEFEEFIGKIIRIDAELAGYVDWEVTRVQEA